MAHIKNIVGNKYNRLLVEKINGPYIDSHNNRKGYKYDCLCDCGKRIIVLGHHLTSGETKSCGCYRKEVNSKNARIQGIKNRKGTKNITGEHLASIRHSAKKRGLEFSVSHEYIQSLLESQNFKCALSGLTLIMDISNSRRLKNDRLNTGSLDRIDSSKGYVEGNIQWVHKDLNWMKQDYTQEEFINYCLAVVKTHRPEYLK